MVSQLQICMIARRESLARAKATLGCRSETSNQLFSDWAGDTIAGDGMATNS